jgi:hypothetical protein
MNNRIGLVRYDDCAEVASVRTSLFGSTKLRRDPLLTIASFNVICRLGMSKLNAGLGLPWTGTALSHREMAT